MYQGSPFKLFIIFAILALQRGTSGVEKSDEQSKKQAADWSRVPAGIAGTYANNNAHLCLYTSRGFFLSFILPDSERYKKIVSS